MKLFATNSRTELVWQVETQRITNRQMRLLMNMALIMIDPAARGKCVVAAREEGDKLVLDVEALGQFSKLKEEVLDALSARSRAAAGAAGGAALFHQRPGAGSGLLAGATHRAAGGRAEGHRATSYGLTASHDFPKVSAAAAEPQQFLNPHAGICLWHVISCRGKCAMDDLLSEFLTEDGREPRRRRCGAGAL